MIITALYGMFSTIATWVLGLLPGFNVDTSVAGPNGLLAPVASYAVDLSGWIPWGVVIVWFPVVMSVYGASLLVRSLRFIKQLIPAIG